MLNFDDIIISGKSQGFEIKEFAFSPQKDQAVVIIESKRRTCECECPVCKSEVHIYDSFHINIKDMPLWKDIPLTLSCLGHRYRCTKCGKTFTENVPFVYPGTRISYRAANWIKSFLDNKLSIRAIQNITGIHWDTIRKIQIETMEASLFEREQELKSENYKPRYLAVDEFAIHKGHSYATCVMDLETGDVLWVGKGRSINDFARFFEEMPSDTLSAVIAVAMDMNASYNKLVEQYLPHAQIVYDRYHMQAQFSKDVLGVVRLEEAKKHKKAAHEFLSDAKNETDKAKRAELLGKSNEEKKLYSKLKRSRWQLLRNGQNLSEKCTEYLDAILQEHENLAVCYAMKEEMCRLFQLTDASEADAGWKNWFLAAAESGIPALVHFAELKIKRLTGLISHAIYPISTGKLEGFNNKVKVAKRIGYGYRDDSYFFTLVRYLSLPSVRTLSHNFP